MQLIGNFLSPYVRRVAISLNAVGIPFTMRLVFVSKDPDVARAYNPVARIPTLLLDNGESLVESYAILDEIDQMAGPERSLCPPFGEERRRVMKITAVALASTEKAQTAYYETRSRPRELIYQPWIDRNDRQALDGFRFLDALASEAGDNRWLGGTNHLSQADITSVVAYTFATTIRPRLGLAAAVPHLARFATRCEDLSIFRSAPVPSF
jgi:glutathione S-transferase